MFNFQYKQHEEHIFDTNGQNQFMWIILNIEYYNSRRTKEWKILTNRMPMRSEYNGCRNTKCNTECNITNTEYWKIQFKTYEEMKNTRQ